MTGAVWDSCKRLNNISDSNKKACMKEALLKVSVLRDTFKECSKYMEDDEDDDWDDLLDDMDASELGEEAEEAEQTEQVARSIVSSLQNMQHTLEGVFKYLFAFLSIVDCTRRCLLLFLAR